MNGSNALEYLADQLLITSQQVAAVLGISKPTLFRMTENGELSPAYRTPGGAYRFRLKDVAVYISESFTCEEAQ
jgi:excisionase family DNA binding protein